MTTREEIKEGIRRLIVDWIRKNYPIGNETFSDLVKRIQEYEDSQGVVIKVEGELPDIFTLFGGMKLADRYKNEIIDAGCGFFEPLIKDGK